VSKPPRSMPTRQTAPTTLEEARDYLRELLQHAQEHMDYWSPKGAYEEQHNYYSGRHDGLEQALGCLQYVIGP